MQSVIIDTDPGVDDAIAILMALAAPSVELAGLTVVGGNVPHARCLRNALALVEYAGRADVPVHRGSNRPLAGQFASARHFHGSSGLTRRLPAPITQPAPERAVDFLAHQLAQHPGQITLVAIGPLTNLARLERRRPGSLALAASMVIMGGAVETPGNITPHAEFNFYCDPVAAHDVMNSGVPLTLVDLAACRQVSMSRETALSLRSNNPLGLLAAEIIQNWFRADDRRESMLFYDQIAMAAAFCPEVITSRQATLAVETGRRGSRRQPGSRPGRPSCRGRPGGRGKVVWFDGEMAGVGGGVISEDSQSALNRFEAVNVVVNCLATEEVVGRSSRLYPLVVPGHFTGLAQITIGIPGIHVAIIFQQDIAPTMGRQPDWNIWLADYVIGMENGKAELGNRKGRVIVQTGFKVVQSRIEGRDNGPVSIAITGADEFVRHRLIVMRLLDMNGPPTHYSRYPFAKIWFPRRTLTG